MPAPQKIKNLVKKFEENYKHYQSKSYREQDLRHEFLNPFFHALGWDMEDRQNLGPRRDVRYEEQTKSGAPDFGFYLNDKLCFFVEAKNPSVNVCNNPIAALQLRSYGWSAKTARGILTDFEELAIYDCAVRPKANDAAKIARIDCIKYTEFVERWDEIAAIFSKEAVENGSLEKLEKKRAKEAVDDNFLKDISHWRESLAKNIALRNTKLTEEQMNTAVQGTINRIIFLRICEDRGIEQYGKLEKIAEKEKCYTLLLDIFKKADERYDSSLFRIGFEKDIQIDDKIIKEIISELYFPKSPYKFDAISADILGKVYEQFLGKVIRLTSGHQAKVEEKYEVRKAGGVYYTPVYIVDYIVKNTVGELLKNKTPKQISELSVLDPACGSGSFLIGAYQYLMDWYRDWYAKNDAKKNEKKKLIYKDNSGGWRLTLEERKRILVSHIYGVDIDKQATEVAKLSLLLKALEAPEQKSLFNERLLPELDKNIKCGNALIGTDYFSGQMLPDTEEMARINPFDWDGKDGFPEIMSRGGFDAVIGNPPYISYSGRQSEKLPSVIEKYYRNKYSSMKWPTTHSLFIEQSVKNISQRFTAFIIPDQVGHLDGYKSIREIIMKNTKLKDIKYWGEEVFSDATTPALTFIADKNYKGDINIKPFNNIASTVKLNPGDTWRPINMNQKLIDKLEVGTFKLGNLVADPGVHTGNCSPKIIINEPTANSVLVLEGKQIDRYLCLKPNKYLRLDYKPKAGEYFTIRSEKKYSDASFVIRQTAPYPIVGPRFYTSYFRNSLLALYNPQDIHIYYIVGLLNSKLIKWLYGQIVQESKQKAFPQVKVKSIRALPIKLIDLSKKFDKEQHDKIVGLVDKMLSLNKQLQKIKSNSERIALQRQIDATDKQIDDLVYKLYNLTPEEIKIVEENLKK